MYALHKLKCFVLYCCFITGNHCRKKLQGLTNMQQGRCYRQWKMQKVKDAVGPPTITQRNRRSPHSSHFPRNKQTRTHAHTHTFNSPLSGTTRVSRYQRGKTNLDFTEARDSEWLWHQLGHSKSASHSRQTTTPAPHHSIFLQAGYPSCHPTNSVKALQALPKKVDLKQCANYRTIALVSYASKILLWIILERIRVKTEMEIADE